MALQKIKAGKDHLLKHSSPLSKAHMLVVVAVFAGIGGYILFRTFAASPLVTSIEAEQMVPPAGASVFTDSSASGGKALKLSSNGTAAGTVSFPSSVTSLSVVAKGDACNGSPAMSVSLDGVSYLSNTSVSSSSWSAYSATPASAIASGTHTLSVSFTNAYTNPGHGKKGNGACSRILYIDVTDFYGPSVTTPVPTVTLSASPSSVTAGQSSTLTWNSTSANACLASGAWSGTQATSGTVSTGAINQNSTYTLTCTGDGGSASATATVTVGAGFTTSLTQGMTITPPYTWTFNPGVASVKGYFWADGQLLYSGAPNSDGSYSFIIQSTTLSEGSHTLGHAWDLADGTHQSGPVNYSVTIGASSSSALGGKLPIRMAESSGSQTLYASPGGSGTNCSLSSPCSLLTAWGKAASGTIINLLGGSYSGVIALQNKSFSNTNPLTIQSNSGQTAVFTGCSSSCSSNIIFFGNVVGVRLRNVVVTGTNSHGSGLKLDDVAHFEVYHSTFHDLYGNGILVVGDPETNVPRTYSSDIQIVSNTFYNTAMQNGPNTTNQADAIYFGSGDYANSVQSGVVGALIANNLFYNQPNGYEIQLGNEAVQTIITNNVFDRTTGTAGSSGSGIVVWGAGNFPSNNDIIINNIFTTNAAHAIQSNCSGALSNISVLGNLSYQNAQSPDYLGVYGTTVCFTPGSNFSNSNPLYVSPANHDYHLQAGSPAIGKSNPDYTPAFDHDGNARSSAPNLGAY